eukprot:gb/GECH01000102.1/.p1 GENE.gb/GECH01000102.1/~~gb/GECH01000102.1/.p1  ORF type:complete len:465 (+),score=84.84 gb/GECH01000102.1/:1-1395(+)
MEESNGKPVFFLTFGIVTLTCLVLGFSLIIRFLKNLFSSKKKSDVSEEKPQKENNRNHSDSMKDFKPTEFPTEYKKQKKKKKKQSNKSKKKDLYNFDDAIENTQKSEKTSSESNFKKEKRVMLPIPKKIKHERMIKEIPFKFPIVDIGLSDKILSVIGRDHKKFGYAFIKNLNKDRFKLKTTDMGNDSALSCSISFDNQLMVVSTFQKDSISVYNIDMDENNNLISMELKHKFPPYLHPAEIIQVQFIPGTHLFISSINSSKESKLKIFDANTQNMVCHIAAHGLRNRMFSISPDGHFLAIATSLSEIHIWWVGERTSIQKVIYDRGDQVMEAGGHSGSIRWLSFSSDSQLLASISDDGTCKVFDLNVRFHMGEHPHLLKTIHIAQHVESRVSVMDKVMFSPSNSDILIFNHGVHVYIFDYSSNKVLDHFATHRGGLYVANTLLGTNYVVTGGADSTARVWNVN